MKIRVALDTNPLYTTQAGIARYVDGLRRGIAIVDPQDISVETIAWRVENHNYNQPLRAVKTLYREMIWSTLVAPAITAGQQFKILHTTGCAPIASGKNTLSIATINDCSVIVNPKRFRKWTRYTGRHYMRQLAKSDRIICISQFSADEAMRLLSIPARKIEVVLLGNTFALKDMSDGDCDDAPPLPDEFLLFVGSLEPGKRLSLLRDVYDLARERGNPLPPLVILGSRWAGVPSEGPPPSDWIYLGRQPDKVLAHCYKKALALVFPSEYEGFGLPIVEAMSFGCPVICSPLASIPEVAGDAAVFADQNPASYLEAIVALADGDSLRQDRSCAGKEQATKFTWKRCAEETLDVYRAVMA